MEIGCSATEQAIMDVLRAANLPGAPDQILIRPDDVDDLSRRIFDHLHTQKFLVAEFDLDRDREVAIRAIARAMLSAREYDLPVSGGQKSELLIAGQIFSALDPLKFLSYRNIDS